VFATLDAGAKRTLGVYFMYDVKQANPDEWSSPPWEARRLDMPGLGNVIMGRGAVNQKGPQSAFLAALHAFRAAGASCRSTSCSSPKARKKSARHTSTRWCAHRGAGAARQDRRVFMPFASHGLDGNITINLGAKGVVELELIASGERWGRGPGKDVHSSLRAMLDSPSFHLVQALNSLVNADGSPAIDGLTDRVVPLSVRPVAGGRRRTTPRRGDLPEVVLDPALRLRRGLPPGARKPRLAADGEHRGPRGWLHRPRRHDRAANEGDGQARLRLVPDMTFDDTIAKLKAHLERRGFGDIEVKRAAVTTPPARPPMRG